MGGFLNAKGAKGEDFLTAKGAKERRKGRNDVQLSILHSPFSILNSQFSTKHTDDTDITDEHRFYPRKSVQPASSACHNSQFTIHKSHNIN
jgi:hypothetical protein